MGTNLKLCSVPEGIPDPVILVLTTAQAAKALGMSPQKFRKLAQSGEIPARVWIDGTHRFYWFDLVEWAERRPRWDREQDMQPAALRRVKG